MAALVHTVATGSFSAAARTLALTPSALSKLIKRLEDRLGVRLFHRSTRHLQLTPEGEVYYVKARQILAAIDEAESELLNAAGHPRGLLRLHCGLDFGWRWLTPFIPDFLSRYPEVELALTIGDDSVAVDGIDLSIRLGTQNDSSQVARRLRNVEQLIVAAPSYLNIRGTPHTPDDLLKHNCLWISALPALRRWPFDTEDGLRVVPVNGNVIANHAEAVLQIALAGVGITRLPSLLVNEAISRHELVPVLTHWHYPEPAPLYAVYPSNRHLSPKVRAMIDFLIEALADARLPS
jgi:DNA-binding transcriptional LysR family regulator